MFFFETFIYSYEYIFITQKVEVYKMPNKDKTGPEGKGPKTGRQMGICEGINSNGRGLGPCGKGMKRGLGRRFCNNSSDSENQNA